VPPAKKVSNSLGSCSGPYVSPGGIKEIYNIHIGGGEAVPDVQEVAKQLREALGECLTHGYKPPLYVAAIAPNGTMLYMRYDQANTNDGLEVTKLAEYCADESFSLPGNIVIADSTGRATRLVLTSEKVEPQD
jgi:hypothetical protein